MVPLFHLTMRKRQPPVKEPNRAVSNLSLRIRVNTKDTKTNKAHVNMGLSSVHWMLRITVMCSVILCGQCMATCKLTVRRLRKISDNRKSGGRELYTVTQTIYNGWNQYECSLEEKKDGLYFTSIGGLPWSKEIIGPIVEAQNLTVENQLEGFIAQWKNKVYNFEVNVDPNEIVSKKLQNFMFRDPIYRKRLAGESARYSDWKQKDYQDALKNHFKFGNFNFSIGHKVFCYGDKTSKRKKRCQTMPRNKNKPYWIIGKFESGDQKMFTVTLTDPSEWSHSLGTTKKVDVRTVSHFHVEGERVCALCQDGDAYDPTEDASTEVTCTDTTWMMIAACGHIMHHCCLKELERVEKEKEPYELVKDNDTSHGAYIKANKILCFECRCPRTTDSPTDIRKGCAAVGDSLRLAGPGMTMYAAWARATWWCGCARKTEQD